MATRPWCGAPAVAAVQLSPAWGGGRAADRTALPRPAASARATVAAVWPVAPHESADGPGRPSVTGVLPCRLRVTALRSGREQPHDLLVGQFVPAHRPAPALALPTDRQRC